MKNRLFNKYKQEVVPQLKQELKLDNDLAVPRITKVTVNAGVGQGLKDNNFIEMVENNLAAITGQKPVKTAARKSISSFKIREGMVVGLKVTLRDKRMYDFLDKLINITLPRIRDFRGLPADSVDQSGNLSIGFKEQSAFPEIKSESLEKLHGLEVNITTTALDKKSGCALFEKLGFPFRKGT